MSFDVSGTVYSTHSAGEAYSVLTWSEMRLVMNIRG